jgi:hypothetical protein
MKIEVLVIDDSAIVVKGLRSAAESRSIADAAEAKRRSSMMATLAEEKFMERAMKEIIGRISYESGEGRREACVSGYGDRGSPFRSYDIYKYNLMEEIIQHQIFPILRQRGYRCEVKRGYFATNEKYFDVKISW